MTIGLLLVDDHAMVRRGLQVFLSTQPDIKVIGEASNGREALERTAELQPDIILMDLHMPVMDGIETAKQLRVSHPQVKIIVLTSFSDQDHVLPAIRVGIKGYLLKDIEPEALVVAIRKVHSGQVELHSAAASQLMNLMAASTPEQLNVSNSDLNGSSTTSVTITGSELLTPREQEVLDLIALGMSNKEIASKLVITEKTVKTHVSHVLGKLNLSDRTQAAIFALKSGYNS
ncbi:MULTISPECIES: response regulator [Paenibacillus]|uniref:DNA-binding response regulator n=1 Tax=Paenibacillus odorifer TaxID=189426 RepID=A0A1R0ZFW8_9BACL|nr:MULTISPECIES: response regulator transcription factor [Paenibacillus]AIQ26555.1 LuxR family transcriptional regulator [Paenibacillus sp. FSL H7-0737]OME69240.1 DNA-binding response regulator [Paenibacillus odorifer]